MMKSFKLFFALCAVFGGICPVQADNCLGLIFIIEDSTSICADTNVTQIFALNMVERYFVDPNGFAQGLYNDQMYLLAWREKDDFDDFLTNDIPLPCNSDVPISYVSAASSVYNFIQSGGYSSYGIIWAGSLDVLAEDSASTMAAVQTLASLNVPTFVWDFSSSTQNQQIFRTLTRNRQDRILTDPNASLETVTSFFMREAIPLLQQASCGNPPTVLPSIQPATASSAPATTPSATTTSNTQTTTTAAPTGNTSCVGLELIFILDRSESMVPTIYNNNITAFVNAFVQGYTFPEETDGEHLGYIRLGVIQFSDTPDVSIPLGNYSRSQFSSLVNNNVNIGDNSGVNNLESALLAAYSQFQHNSTSKNRAIILIVDDVSTVSMDDSIDALAKLKSFVNLPMGAIVPGFSGTPAEGLAHLLILLGNDSTLAFPDLATASTAAPKLISKKYPCQLPPACSALVFLEESTVSVGASSKLSFLKLAAQLAAASSRSSFQRFAIALFGGEVYHGIELQTFAEFNATINAFVETMAADNFPNSGITYLDPILTQLQQVYSQSLVRNMTVVVISETESLRNPAAANAAAVKVAALGLNVYVLDASRFTVPGNLFKTLTNNVSGHVLNATFTDPLAFAGQLTGSAVSEFNAMVC